MLFNANLLLITERYREEDLDESSNYSAPRPDGKWVEYTDTGDIFYNFCHDEERRQVEQNKNIRIQIRTDPIRTEVWK